MATTLTVYEWMSDFDHEELPFDEWREALEDAVRMFNEENGAEFSPSQCFYNYCNMEIKRRNPEE